jgi:DNA polymerase-3 subunit beta
MNKTAFNAIKKVAKRRRTLPIIDRAALITPTSITATDLDVYIKVDMPSNWHVSGSGVLSFDVLASMVDALRVEITFRDGTAAVNVDGRQFMADAMDARDFPDTADDGKFETTGQLAGADVSAVLDFVSDDDLRAAINGVYISDHVVATNGHVLRFRRSGYDGVPFILRAVAGEVMRVYYKAAKGRSDMWNVALEREHVRLQRDGVTLYARLILETYPNWQSVVPKDNERWMSVSVDNVKRALKDLKPCISSESKRVVFEMEPGNVVISADSETGRFGSVKVPATVDGFPSAFRIGYSAGYLDKIASNVDAKTLLFQIDAPNRAAIINDEILLMPVMLPA